MRKVNSANKIKILIFKLHKIEVDVEKIEVSIDAGPTTKNKLYNTLMNASKNYLSNANRN